MHGNITVGVRIGERLNDKGLAGESKECVYIETNIYLEGLCICPVIDNAGGRKTSKRNEWYKMVLGKVGCKCKWRRWEGLKAPFYRM